MKYVHLGFSPVRKWQFKSANSVKLSVEVADLLMSNFFPTIHNFIFFFYLDSTKQVAIREKVKNMQILLHNSRW